MSDEALRLEDISKSFGGLHAVASVNLTVASGTIHGIVGPNGAGKTTLFNLVSGLQPVSAGRIVFGDGQNITDWPAHARAQAGIARTFQTPKLFEDMNVLETVMTGYHPHLKLGIVGNIFSMARKREEEARVLDVARGILDQVGLAEHANALARDLSYGRRRLLEIGRALALQPKLLMLDEATAGLNPTETDEIAGLIRRIAANGVTVLLVEHDMRFVTSVCEILTVLHFGAKIAEGSPQFVLEDPAVVDAYLGNRRMRKN